MSRPKKQLPVPLILLMLTASVVVQWSHIIGHSSLDSAHSSHMAPVMLLSSIVIVTGVVVFFLLNVLSSAVRYVCFARGQLLCFCWKAKAGSIFSPIRGRSSSSPYEYYDSGLEEDERQGSGSSMHSMDMSGGFHGEFVIEEETPKKDNDGTAQPMAQGSSSTKEDKKQALATEQEDDYDDESDMDGYAYASSGLVEYKENIKTEKLGGRNTKMLSGDIFTVTMIWTNVYGLGLACFLLMPVITMASSLSTFSFLLGLNAVTVLEAVQERRDPHYKFRQWRAGKIGARMRNGMHVAALMLANIALFLVGTSIFSMHINQAGQIKVEDIFFGIIAPILTPVLLKGVRRPHTTILGTMEVALPFSAFLASTFMISVLAMGMKPFEIREHLARNMVAVTVVLPGFFGAVVMYTLDCTLRRRMLYAMCTLLLVFVGKQFTFSKEQPVVLGAFLISGIAFLLVLMTSSKQIMNILSKK